jgi:hypothetical protein
MILSPVVLLLPGLCLLAFSSSPEIVALSVQGFFKATPHGNITLIKQKLNAIGQLQLLTAHQFLFPSV